MDNIMNTVNDSVIYIKKVLFNLNTLNALSTILICVIIITVFFYGVTIIRRSKKNALSMIKQLKTSFSKYDTITRDTINTLSDDFEGNEAKSIWKKFKDSLVYTKNKVGDDVFYSTYPIKDFFDLNLVGGEMVSSKLIPAIPAILTGLGLAGTFLGLTLGLFAYNPNEGTEGIIAGAKTAFITSLAGILLSLWVNYYDKTTVKVIKEKLRELKNILYPLFPQIKLEETFISIENYNKNINDAMGELAEKIGNKMQEGMIEATSKMNSEISSALEKLISSTQTWGERVASGSEGVLSSLISEFNDKIGANASSQREMLEEAAGKMATVVSSLDEMMKKYNETTNESFENIKKQQEEANKQHIDNLNEYNNKLTEVAGDVFKNQERQAQIIDTLLDKCSSVSTELSSELIDLKSNLSSVNTKLTNIITKFNNTVEKLDDATERLEKTGDVFQDAGEKIATPINKTVSIFEELTEKTLQTQTNIENISQNLADLASESEEILNSVNTLFEKSNNSFNELSRQQTSFLNQLKENMSDLHQEVVESFENYKESVANQTNERLEQWNEKTNQFSSSMLNTVKAIQSIVDDVEKKVS